MGIIYVRKREKSDDSEVLQDAAITRGANANLLTSIVSLCFGEFILFIHTTAVVSQQSSITR